MMFRKLTLITALAGTLAFPAVALAAHGGHGGGGHGGGGWHGGGGHGGGWHGGGHGGGWHGGGVVGTAAAGMAVVGMAGLAWRRGAAILGWSLVALRRWPVLAVVLRHLELGLLTKRNFL